MDSIDSPSASSQIINGDLPPVLEIKRENFIERSINGTHQVQVSLVLDLT